MQLATKRITNMQATLNWYLKNRIIYVRPVGEVTIDNVNELNAQGLEMLDAGTPSVHVIIETRYVTVMPTNLLQWSYATSFIKHPSKGWLITIANTPMASFLARIIPQIAGCQRYRVFSELETGLEFLKQQDPSLNWADTNQELIA